MSVVVSPPTYAMQDFRPRISSTYQPRQSLSHLVSKFENLDNKQQRSSGASAVPRRAKTLPTVPPGQWLSSGTVNEKQPMEGTRLTPASTFGQRQRSVAERRKLFEDANCLLNGRSSGPRVFSRDVALNPSQPGNNQALLQVALETREHVETRHSTDAIRKVRRMPRLEVTRDIPQPSDEPEWPLKSQSPVRASFDTYHAARTSVEWKPTPARERSLSRRRGEDKPIAIEAAHRDVSPIRKHSGETGTIVSTVEEVSIMQESEEPADADTWIQEPQAKDGLGSLASLTKHADPDLKSTTQKTGVLSKTESAELSIGYVSAHSTAAPDPPPLPESKSTGVFFPARNSGSWAAKQSSSPLKDKIGIFESLSRQGGAVESTQSAAGTDHQLPPQPHRNISKHSASLSRTANRIKATLRKISVSWERGHGNYLSSAKKENDGAWSGGKESEHSKAQDSTRQHPNAHDEKRPASKVNIRRFFSPDSSRSATGISPTSYNTIRRETHPKASSIGASTDSMGLHGVFGSDNTTSTHTAPVTAKPALRPEAKNESRRPSWGKRRISRSSGGPMYARVQCKLDQPMPVRSDEVKRLVTLCKDGALRRSRGQTG